MNKPDLMRMIVGVSLAGMTLGASALTAARERDDTPFEAGRRQAFPAPSGFFHVPSATRAAETYLPDSALALCMPDLYCQLVPDTNARDNAFPRLARATRAGVHH
ncbi:hypothetical protein [Caballeronia novacaledonica]|uniref:Uncharacterized protein n=1 Tax=Caballeronia novacaledonica TaxID=1544861 RepID=A0AA37IJB7_9BURK|nr:hypothetical protein [Caballeronia novacaledonica]GJH30398.1 hypothetical protein CBA19CS42_37800 [Caballeronia novacaledonica]